MKRSTFIILTIMFLCLPLAAHAQKGNVQLSEQAQEEMKVRTAEKIESFITLLGYVASKDNSVQDEAIKSVLALFIGNGGPYSLEDMYGHSTNYNGVTMQTASLRSRRATPRYNRPVLMKRYLNNLRGIRYDKVNISQVGSIRVDNIYLTSKGHYQAIAHYSMDFAGYIDGNVVYHDVTTKSVKVYIELIDDGGSGTWQVLLGDMRVESITK